MKKVYITGMGVGDASCVHPRAADIIKSCGCIIGARRMTEGLADASTSVYECIHPEKIRDYILSRDDIDKFCVAVSGDPGFYSLAASLRGVLEAAGIETETVPAVGSMQYFCARLGISWDSVEFMSAHGREGLIVPRVMFCKYLFVLTGGSRSPAALCRQLTESGLGSVTVSVGENLSYPNERIVTDSARQIADHCFLSLSVMLVINEEAISPDEGLRSIRDEEFITGSPPMTKREVRSLSIARLDLRRGHTVYDVGAGTGSVSVEAALRLTAGQLYAIECDREAVSLIRRNREKFRASNITVVEGTAPEALKELPAPDAVFIGGSQGSMEDIVKTVLTKNPQATIVINAITLQSLGEAVRLTEKYKLNQVETICVNVAKSKKAGRYDLMTAQNPIYIISGKGRGRQ